MFFKFMYRAVTVLLLIAVTVAMFVNYTEERETGRYTGTTSLMRPDDKRFVIETFGKYETFDELLDGMTEFVFDNFVYDLDAMQKPLQEFDFQRYRNSSWRGVCLDYSQWAKSVVLVWSEYKNQDVQCYVFDVLTKNGSGHSYNYFIYEENTYLVDFTSAQTKYKRGDSYESEIRNLGKVSMYDYAVNHFGDRIMKVY